MWVAHLGLSKPKLVVEIAKGKTQHYIKICKEVKNGIEIDKHSKIEAKELAMKLIRKYS